jgi:AcrR family transcriptional regulator
MRTRSPLPVPPREETRERILAAAVRRFSTEGFNAASVDGICSDAGVSKGAFYYHFKSKQTLFLALLDDWLQSLEQSLDTMRGSTIPDTLILMTNMLPTVLDSAQDNLILWLEFWLQAVRDRTVWKATIAPYHHYRALFAKLVQDGIAEGTLRPTDPEATAQAIVSMAVGLFLQGILDPRGADWQNTARQSMQILMNGLLASSPPPTPRRKRS